MKRFLLWAISPLYWAGAAAAVIGLGSAVYSAKKQESAIEDAERAEEKAAAQAEEERKRIFENTKPDGMEATATFGAPDDGEKVGSYNDFLAPTAEKSRATLGGGMSSGLGFGV